jgi:hypothetical protein
VQGLSGTLEELCKNPSQQVLIHKKFNVSDTLLKNQTDVTGLRDCNPA